MAAVKAAQRQGLGLYRCHIMRERNGLQSQPGEPRPERPWGRSPRNRPRALLFPSGEKERGGKGEKATITERWRLTLRLLALRACSAAQSAPGGAKRHKRPEGPLTPPGAEPPTPRSPKGSAWGHRRPAGWPTAFCVALWQAALAALP